MVDGGIGETGSVVALVFLGTHSNSPRDDDHRGEWALLRRTHAVLYTNFVYVNRFSQIPLDAKRNV